MNLSNLSGLWTRYLELTGDTEFLISSVVLCLGIIIFLFLLSKLAKTKTVPIGTFPRDPAGISNRRSAGL